MIINPLENVNQPNARYRFTVKTSERRAGTRMSLLVHVLHAPRADSVWSERQPVFPASPVPVVALEKPSQI